MAVNFFHFGILNNVIGILDSGAGGINVVLECMKYYTQDFIYLLDNKNCPYGNKEKDELIRILNNNINYLLKNYNLDLIIIACNTLSSLVNYEDLLKYKIPVLKTIPQLNNLKKQGEEVLVFATKNTIKNCKELKLIKNNYTGIKTLNIKGLAKIIDNYLSKKNEQKLKSVLKEEFLYKNKLKNKYKNIKIIALGCTHFNHIQCFLNEIFNNKISYLCCEENVAKNSKWLIRKNAKNSTLKLVLTKQDEKLEDVVYNIFKNNIKE